MSEHEELSARRPYNAPPRFKLRDEDAGKTA